MACSKYQKYVYVSINDVVVKHQADSASDINLWPHNTFRESCSKWGFTPQLIPDSKPVKAVNGTSVVVKGYFEATLSSTKASKTSKVYVMAADQNDAPLMSRFDLFDLRYVRIDPVGHMQQIKCHMTMTMKCLTRTLKQLWRSYTRLMNQYSVELEDISITQWTFNLNRE